MVTRKFATKKLQPFHRGFYLIALIEQAEQWEQEIILDLTAANNRNYPPQPSWREVPRHFIEQDRPAIDTQEKD